MSFFLAASLEHPAWGLAIIGAIFALGGAVKGMLGFGMPSVVMACLGFMMAPSRAAAFMIVPALVTNVWQVFAGPALAGVLRRFWLLLAAIVTGTVGGVVLLGPRLGMGATVLLGAVLALYGIVGLTTRARRRELAPHPALTLAVGLTTGVLNAATGISVMPLVPYLNALRLEKEDLVQTLGVCFLVAIAALGVGLTAAAEMRLSAAEFLVPLLGSLAGMAIGQAVRQRIRAEVFRRYFFLGLAAMGSYMALRAV